MAAKKTSKKITKPKAQTKKKTVKKAAKKVAKKSAKKAVKKAARTQKAKKQKKKAAPRKAGGAGKAAQKPVSAGKRKEHMRQILLRKRTEVVQGLEQHLGRKLSSEPGQRIDSAMDSADLSTMDMDQDVDYSLLEMKYNQYKDTADALRRLQNDTYGLCEECGEEIDIKRLEVNPLARYCIACKTQKESMERIQKEETRFKE